MNEKTLLTAASLVTIVLFTIHQADDVVRGMVPGRFLNLVIIAMGSIWLYATLMLVGRRSGYIIVLVFSLLMLVIPVVHMMGPGMGFGTTRSNGLLFVWTVLAIGVTSLFSIALSVRGLLSLRRRLPMARPAPNQALERTDSAE
jgi:hypothetical protein